MNFFGKHWLTLLVVLVLLIFSYFAIALRAAINMDEFSQYHPLICHVYPNNQLNTFQEACGVYDLVLPGTSITLPLRAYGYGGSLPSLYYLPMFLLWPSPESARMMGVIFLLLQAWAISKLIRKKFSYVAIGLTVFFPYIYQNMVDTGLIHFYGTVILFCTLFIERWFTTQKNRYILGTGILLFLMFWTRLSFVYAIPAMLLAFTAYGIYYYKSWKPQLKPMLKAALFSGVLMGVLVALYFFATSPALPGQNPILAEVNRFPTRNFLSLLNPSTYLHSELLRRFLSPLETTSRAYTMHKIMPVDLLYTLVLFATPLLTLLWQVYKGWRHEHKFGKHILNRINRKALLFYIMFLVTAMLLFRSLDAKFMHHAVMSYPFLILSWGFILGDIAKFLPNLWFKGFIAFLLLFNLYYFVVYTNSPVNNSDDFSKVKVNEVLKSNYLSKKYFYVVSNWGIYFYQGLYGPKEQSVLYIENYINDPSTMSTLAEYPQHYGRGLLYIYNKEVPGVVAKIKAFQPGLVECDLTKNSQGWSILMPEDNSADNPCR